MNIEDLLDTYYQSLEQKVLNKVVILPQSMMIENSEDEDGWFLWKPTKQYLTAEDLKCVEEKYKLKIPEQYKEYILSMQFMDIQINNTTLYGINEYNSIDKLFSMFPSHILSFGFIPIGQVNDEEFLALNTNSGEVVCLGYDNYELKKVLSKDFFTFIKDFIEGK